MSRDGFFPESTTLSTKKDDHLSLPKCESCKLYQTCNSPKMPLYGYGEKKILVVGEAPGETEDLKNKPFVGKAGQRLRNALDSLGIDLKRDCWTTNALICRPPDNKIDKPDLRVAYCRPNLIKVITDNKPRVIILLGGVAVSSLIRWLWKDKTGPVTTWVGWQIPSQQLNAWVCPTYHPSYVERMKNKVLDWNFVEHLKKAVGLAQARPWKKVPDWPSRVEVITDDKEAAEKVYEIIKQKEPTAADYETNFLKTEYAGAKILSCALSVMGSEKAISFPFQGKVIKVLGEFWFSRVPKIASNIKYEDRATRWYYGKWVKNWYLDTMLMAHFLDCRNGVTGLKFQIFVRKGVGAYSDHIEPLFKNAVGRKVNDAEFRIDQRQLLQYGGEDALYEGMVGEDQLKEMKLR